MSRQTLTALLLGSTILFLVLAAADRVSAYLHETGIRILTRMMGLLLTAINQVAVALGSFRIPMAPRANRARASREHQ